MNCHQINNCVSNGFGCVNYSKCELYKTQIACDNGGTDG